LRELLWTCDPALVADAAGALSTLGDEETVTMAVRRLRTGLTPERCRAGRVLERFADRRATPALCESLSDVDASVRVSALDALARLGRDPDVADAAASLIADSSEQVRLHAVRAIGCLSGDHAATLRRAIDDPAPAVRQEAGRLAARLGRSDVERLLADANVEVRCAAAGGAGRRAVSPLAATLRSDPHPRVRAQAAQTLGTIGGVVAMSALVDAIVGDRNATVRARSLRLASDALSERGLAGCLRHELLSANASRREMALRALARLSGVTLSDAETTKIARDTDSGVRLALAQLAAVLALRPKGVYVLLAGDEDPAVRHAAALGLERPAS
jgi:HEAT repeat protein